MGKDRDFVGECVEVGKEAARERLNEIIDEESENRLYYERDSIINETLDNIRHNTLLKISNEKKKLFENNFL